MKLHLTDSATVGGYGLLFRDGGTGPWTGVRAEAQGGDEGGEPQKLRSDRIRETPCAPRSVGQWHA